MSRPFWSCRLSRLRLQEVGTERSVMDGRTLHHIRGRRTPPGIRTTPEGLLGGGPEPSCFWCGRGVSGRVVRLSVGTIQYHKTGIYFREDIFRDGQASKWLHLPCRPSVMPAYLGPEDQPCRICGQQYYPEESVLQVLEGQWNGGLESPTEQYGHFTCLCDEWDVPLWDIRSDW